MKQVTHQTFHQAGVKPVCGFEFFYKPGDPRYGVCVRTDGTLPQVSNLVEAGRVGLELQRVIFGTVPEQVTLLHPA
ncbi:hypothetical protein [Ottowia sp.]|uniref:hypothetical protein n=1 Tax=Ottowia sp. TaxID=1898956 RepID=UPI0025F64D28|nr:hypothetical protein [Ottowia sp.]MBK6616259.1 hypothetical protein [Ottowia sp.]